MLSTLEDIRSAQDARHERLLVEAENDRRDSETADEGGDRNRTEIIESGEKEMIRNIRSIPEMISSSESSSESEDHRYENIQKSEEQENESDSESEDHRYENIERPEEEPREEEKERMRGFLVLLQDKRSQCRRSQIPEIIRKRIGLFVISTELRMNILTVAPQMQIHQLPVPGREIGLNSLATCLVVQ